MSTYEVENKYRLDDLPALNGHLHDLGAEELGTVDQCDICYNHPSRDFGQTDELLRLRHTNQGDFITYKGPKLSTETKTRRELELPLGSTPHSLQDWRDLLGFLGFQPLVEIRKRRRELALSWLGCIVSVAVDNVEGLGDWVELELIALESEVPTAQATILSLATRLGLTSLERRSYLRMVLQHRASQEAAGAS